MAGSEAEFLDEVPMVLTASRLRQPLAEAPVAMTVIDRDTIEASGLRGIDDLMRFVPGMYVRPASTVEGVVPAVSYHGLSFGFSRRMQVLIDGRSVYLPPFSTVLWNDLPIALDDIERIEVTRGPNAASFGTNAFYGTINIITRTPVADEGAYFRLRGGQDGERDGVARLTGSTGPTSYRLTTGHTADNGFQNLYDAQNHSFITARSDSQVGLHDQLEFQLGFSAGARQLGAPTSEIGQPRTRNLDDGYLQMRWQHDAAPGAETSLQYYLEGHGVRETDITVPLAVPGFPVERWAFDAGYAYYRHQLELQQTLEPSDQLRLVLGAGARVDQTNAPIYFGGQGAITSQFQDTFAHAEWRAAPTLLLQAGGMVEHSSLAGTQIEPRASVTWLPDPDQALRVGVSRATRTPALFDAQGNFGLNFGPFRLPIELTGGNVHSERIRSTEAGYHAALAARTLQLDIKVYRDRASGLIDEVFDANVPLPAFPAVAMVNADDAVVRGIEGELHWTAGPATRLLICGADTLITSRQVPTAANLQRSMPRVVIGSLAEQRLAPQWSASAALFLNTGIPEQLGIPGQEDQPANGFGKRLDLRLAHDMKLPFLRGRVAVGMENALPGFVEYRTSQTFTHRAYLEFTGNL